MASTGESGRWRQVAGVLLAEVDRIGDPAAKAAKLLEIGDVFRDHLGDPPDGLAALRRGGASCAGGLTGRLVEARDAGARAR
jgi:hypothetical protein